MFTAPAKHDRAPCRSGSSTRQGSEHEPTHAAGTPQQAQGFDAAMSPDERRKMTAQWLSTWLKEGDTGPAVN